MHSSLNNKAPSRYTLYQTIGAGEDMRFIPAVSVMMGLMSHAACSAEVLPWSYDGLNDHQDNWAQLSPENKKCEFGTQQSPVIISYTKIEDMKPLAVQYKEAKATVAFSNYTINIIPTEGNVLVVDDINYQLKNIVFHSPSEHTVKEKFYTIEIQLMHESSDGKKLTLAVFADSGEENPGLKPITDNIPGIDGSSKEITINPALLLPDSLGYYAYRGSMTTPPCTEDMEWRVLKKPIGMSYTQMDSIINRIGRNARLEQAIYGRTIRETNF